MSRTLSKSASPVKGSQTISKSWNITNNSGTEIVVINASTDDDQDVNQLYQQSLTILSTADNKSSINDASTAAVTLTGGKKNNSLIIARSDNFFPLKVMTTSGETSVTITKEDVDTLKQAEVFYKTITAFPSSEMATNFAKAVKDGDEVTVKAFFSSTASFTKCTLDAVVAIITYYNRFPFPWISNSAKKTYYLYTSDGTTNKYVGSVVLENQLTPPLNSIDIIEGFTTTYITTNGADSTALSYLDGQFVDDVDSESPTYCLTGVFIQRSQLTKTDTDNMVIPILKGTVNGKDVFGYDVKQERNKEGVFSQLDALFHPSDTLGILELIGAIVIGVAGLVLLGVGAKCLIDFIKKSIKLTPEQIAAKNLEIKAKNRANTQKILDKIDKKLKVPEDVNTSLERIIREGNELLLRQNKSKLYDSAAQQQAMYDKLIEYGNPSSMKKVGAKLGELSETLTDINSRDLGDRMPVLIEDLKFNAATLKEQLSKTKSKFSETENRALETSGKALDSITKTIETNEKIREELMEEKIPEIPFEE